MDARHEEAHDRLEALLAEYPDVFGPGSQEDEPNCRPGDWILIADWHDLDDPDVSSYTYQLERHCHKHHAIGLLHEGLQMIDRAATLDD